MRTSEACQHPSRSRHHGLVIMLLLAQIAFLPIAFAANPPLPAGIGASDWAGIVAAHQAATKNLGPTNSERKTGEAAETISVTQQAYLKASSTASGGEFGYSVAVSGDTAVVGAAYDSSDLSDAGAAYVFVRNGATWTQQALLKASNTDVNDFFGRSVAISGDTIVVGADGEQSNATGINGNQDDNSASNAGAAYVFVRNGTTWTQQAYLKASNTDAFDLFARTVAVSGNTVVVGAFREASNATGINGDEANNGFSDAGAVYVYVRNGTTWTQQAYLKASNTGVGDQFGQSVSISGDTVVVGAEAEKSNATGVNGNQADDSAPYAGAAYVFVRNGTTWTQQAYLKASNTETLDRFGISVAVSGDTAVVGSYYESSNATGVNGDQANNGAFHAGAAYVFVRNGTTWTQQAYLKASNTDVGDEFGAAVAVSGDSVVVGAANEDSGATGINGDQADNNADSAGAAYFFARNGTTWTQQAYLKASNTDLFDLFSFSVAISGETVAVGAIFEASAATGVNGDQADNTAPASGAAYIFTAPARIKLLNISTRLNVGAGDNVLIGGFIVVGTEPKKVLLRAIGPSLADFGLLNVLADPIIELHKPDMSVVTNDNWRDTQEQDIIDTAIPPTNDLESAIVDTLEPGIYTAIVRGQNDGTGVGLVEAYDLDQAADSELGNISTRGFVDTDDNVMIGGFIVGSGTTTTVIVRAIGPSLAGLGIANPLLDPTLELHDNNGTQIAFDDDWKDTQQTDIEATGLAPSDDRESAIQAVLSPGLYTAIVRGKDNTTGVGLMEVYNL